MDERIRRVLKPRCFLVYALAPPALPAAEANRLFNEYLADRDLPLPLFHDHFIGRPGGLALFFVETPAQRDALLDAAGLEGWQVEVRPLVYAYSPAAFDAQIAFTLRAYRGLDWDRVRADRRPAYGDPAREAETAEESNG
jgi:hypothetical protein